MAIDSPNNHRELPLLEAVRVNSPNLTERFNISPVAFGFISLAIIFVLYQIVGGAITIFFFGGMGGVNNIQGFRFATMAGQILLILIPTLVLTRFQTDNIQKGLRLRLTGLWEIFFAVIGILSLQQLLQVYMVAQDQIPIPSSVGPLFESIRKVIEETYRNLVVAHSIPELLYVLLVVALVPACCEELLFRGLIQKNFETAFKRGWGIVVAGTIFGAFHFNPFSFVPLAILGIYFGFLVFRSGSILTSIVAHFVNNLFAVLVVFFSGKETFLLSEGTNNVSVWSLILALGGFGLVFSASTFAFIKLTHGVAERFGE